MDAGQLVLMTLPINGYDRVDQEIICGVILSRLGKKKPQNYEVFAENVVWIATEYDLTPFKDHRLEDIKLS